MDVSKGGFTAVITQGYKVEYAVFTATIKKWYLIEGNRERTLVLAETLQKANPAIGLEELRSPNTFSLQNFKKAIKKAMPKVPSMYQALLAGVDAAVDEAIKRTNREYAKEEPEFDKALSDLKHLVEFPHIRPLPTQIAATGDPAFILAAVAACSTFAEACTGSNQIPNNFVNPVWSRPKDANKRKISVPYLQVLLNLFLPIFRNPFAIYQLLFWDALRNLANTVAHPDLSQPNQYRHFKKKGWMKDSAREVFHQISDFAMDQPELWTKLKEERGRGKKL
jgi:hypothetical protein